MVPEVVILGRILLGMIQALTFSTILTYLKENKTREIVFPVKDSPDQVSLNNVKVVGSPIFDDGLLIIFGIENFFDPNFTTSATPAQLPSFNDCETSYSGDKTFSFHDAGNILISRGYSVMASFLKLQLLDFLSQPSLTLFAPADKVMVDYSSRFPDYPSLFLRHVSTVSLLGLIFFPHGKASFPFLRAGCNGDTIFVLIHIQPTKRFRPVKIDENHRLQPEDIELRFMKFFANMIESWFRRSFYSKC
ncbi:hypothetical protein L1887_11895 [Cichorium endivia]|nr:hypothetical protein L1887_11895 [Cichorium endivia]